jgi:hypothetical protein
MNIPPFMAVLALCATPFAYAQSIAESVYDLPGETGGLFSYLPIEQQVEYGDSAHLGGTNRLLSEASLAIYSDIDRTGVVTFSIYNAVPADFNFPPDFEIGQPGVTPGTLADFKPAIDPLWTSGPQLVSFEGKGASNLNLTELVFSDINVLVPDDLFWSIKFDMLSDYTDGGIFGPKLEDAADLGPAGAETDGSRFYKRPGDRGLGDWIPTWLPVNAPPTSTLSLQLTAIPEPGIVALSLLGTLALLRRRRTA